MENTEWQRVVFNLINLKKHQIFEFAKAFKFFEVFMHQLSNKLLLV